MGSALCFYYGRLLMRVLNHRITEGAIFPATNQETREKNGGEEYLSYGRAQFRNAQYTAGFHHCFE